MTPGSRLAAAVLLTAALTSCTSVRESGQTSTAPTGSADATTPIVTPVLVDVVARDAHGRPLDAAALAVRRERLLAAIARYDTATMEAIRAFQKAERLNIDGRAGEKTLLMLYRRAGGFFPAGLAQKGNTGGAGEKTLSGTEAAQVPMNEEHSR